MAQEMEIIAVHSRRCIGAREVVDWDRRGPAGDVVTHRNVPLVYMRESSYQEWRVAHQDAPHPPSSVWYYAVSVD